MKPRVQIKLDSLGHPFAEVATPCSWIEDLVDYLTFNHLSVSYDLLQNSLRVTFLRQTLADAQNLLNQWTESQPDEDVPTTFSLKEYKHAPFLDRPNRSRRTSVC